MPPGQEGRIEVKVRTGGYGGQNIRESVRLKTNDPQRPILSIGVTGKVEPFAEFRPERVRLEGKAGEPLALYVEIVPHKDYPFRIERLEAQNGTFIRYELKAQCAENGGRCLLRVENLKTEQGNYSDRIIIHTDSALRPVLQLYVSVVIL